MLKKNDLAKQFELLVQQEIKNYNDSLLSINLSINATNDQLKGLSDKNNKDLAVFLSHVKRLDIEIEKLKLAFSDLVSELASQFSDLSVDLIQRAASLEEKVKDLKNIYLNKKEFDETFKEYSQKLSNLEEMFNSKISNCCSETARAEFRCKADLQSLRKEISDKPSEAQEVKRYLEHKIEISAINNHGLVREVEVCKKTSFVIEKKIENLYTLIERLKSCRKPD